MKSNEIYWNDFLNRYRVSKMIRHLRIKKGLGFKQIADITGYSRQYVCNVQEMVIKPNGEFIEKLERLTGENKCL